MAESSFIANPPYINVQKGDIFFVHNDLGDGWLWVTAHRTGEQGLVFKVNNP